MGYIFLSHSIPQQFKPVPSHGIPIKIQFNKRQKIMKIQVQCVLDRTTSTKKDTKRQNSLTLLTLKIRKVHNSLSFWHSLSFMGNAMRAVPSHGTFIVKIPFP